MNMKKAELRRLAKLYGEETVIEVAQGMQTDGVPDDDQRLVIGLYQ
jgi:hypothetical protein